MSDKLEDVNGRVITLERVVVKLFDMFLKTFIFLIVLSFLLVGLMLCWFLGITSSQAVSFYSTLSNTPIWLILLAILGFFGLSYWSLLKLLSKYVHQFYWDKIVLAFIRSIK